MNPVMRRIAAEKRAIVVPLAVVLAAAGVANETVAPDGPLTKLHADVVPVGFTVPL